MQNPNNFGILGADPTFNLGKFNVTVTTYTNLLVVARKTRKHPVMIGPLFMHQVKTYDAYNYFFSKMVSLNKDIANVLAFGTDGKEPLFKRSSWMTSLDAGLMTTVWKVVSL